MDNNLSNTPETIGDLTGRIAALSLEKRAILELRLKKNGACVSAEQTIPCRATPDSGPLSFAQRRLWFLDQYEPDSSVYNVFSGLRLTGRFNIGALEQSLVEIVRRHESLRTRFSMVEGEPVQMIAPSPSFSLAVVDISHFSDSEREDEAQRLATAEAQRPFDLSQGPLFRTSIVRLGEADHVLLLTMHHIVSDGWSTGVLYRELSVLYQAFSEGKPTPLADLAIQYGDYAVWQREWLKGEELGRQLSYWNKQLEGAPGVLNLSTDRRRPAVQSYRGKRQSITLSKELTQLLKALSRKEGVTLFMTLLAAFQTLLYRYTGQEDIVVGSPIANRTRTEIEGLIGFFVNTLVLRSDLSGNPTFREILARVRKTALEAYEHQDLPFEKLVEELHPERSLSHSPLFQVMFVLQNAPSTELKFEGLSVSPVRVGGETAKFDLTLSVHEAAEGLRASLQYNTDLFDESTIIRMLGHFEVLLEGIVADPAQRICQLPLLTQAEKRQLLIEWNDTKRDYREDKCIDELFEEQVERTPDAVALIFEGRQLTYREVNERGNQLAHYLQKLGVGPEVLVGICVERSVEMVIGMLGILKAGGAYVPLDPSYPKERLGFMLEDTQAGIVLTDRVSLESQPPTSARVICLDRDWEEITKEARDNPESESSADSLAYLVYTSGSTGVPKGVEVRHRGVVRLLFGVDYVQLDRAQTFLHLAPMSFDAATFEVWGALLHGGKCVLFPGKVPSPRELGEALKKHQVTTLWLTAALFNTVINEEPQALSEVKQLLIGGEALSVPHVRAGLARLPNTKIINGYGPTESTTFTCCYPIARQLDDNLSSIPIGKPIGNTQVYILDPHLNPVPIGVAGELHIGGDGLARGYLNRPEQTEEKFIGNPFSEDCKSRLYRTGDRARYLPDGNIEFLGREDDQVKIRGYRIELGEIEVVLSRHGGVREAVVLAREESRGEKRLVAYVVAAQDSAFSTNELRSFLKQQLPEYMVPTAIVVLDVLPLTPNGKVDRQALRVPEDGRGVLDGDYVSANSSLQSWLAEVWGEVLGARRIGVHDNFFDLGGHSLLALKLVTRIGEGLQIEVAVRWLFESPTVAGLAARIEAAQSEFLAGQVAKSPWSYLFELKPGSGNKRVFFLPGGYGGDYEFLVYARFVHHVGSEYPFYGLRARSADGTESAHPSVEEMAADYLKEIRSLQPEGPYFLVGNCIGGVVAYEIAQQLKRQGQQIALLALMDTYRPTLSAYLHYCKIRVVRRILPAWKENYYVTRAGYHWKQLRHLDWRNTLPYLLTKAGIVLTDISQQRPQTLLPAYQTNTQTSQPRQRLQEGYVETLRRYRPRPYPGRIHMLANEIAHSKDPTLGWGNLARGGIEVHKVRGDHTAYIRDHVEAAARQLRECLEKAERDV